MCWSMDGRRGKSGGRGVAVRPPASGGVPATCARVISGCQWQTPLAIGLAVVVVVLGGLLLLSTAPIEVVNRPAAEIVMGSAEAIGLALYSVWLFPFEAVSILLLVAMIGAVVMTRDDRKKTSA